ncbi:MAG: glycosyltransferase [Magnetococcales bacterium]|nr:TIGR04282 family arsenosugar biosynthesis glycosyltransferase [Magnetococcales bacterium]NGZ06069.1 glycosyltransferase [Magnetococcales bacterium]
MRISVNLLGRAPEPGFSKTRLIPALGADGAAQAHAALLTHVATILQRWCACAPEQRLFRLWVTPHIHAPLFAQLATPDSVHLQPPGDLGVRLDWIARTGLHEADAVLLVGGDAVSLDLSALNRVEKILTAHVAALVPAMDGGYVLLGLRRHAPELFAGLPWGSSRVAEATRAVLHLLQWSWDEVPGHWDVDWPADWERFRCLEMSWSDNC